MSQRGRVTSFKQLDLTAHRPDSVTRRLDLPVAPAHFAYEERQLWRIVLMERPSIADSAAALAALAVAMEANAVARHTGALLRKQPYDKRLLDVQSRACKAYFTAMKELKVWQR